ncbi:MAG TPA: hypothetical protein VK154_16530 [Chitinophagales bacterium]|nr:hypothetical protein [Chitinophagales bacterium]
MARGITGVADVSPYLYSDLNKIMVRENSSGKICSPARMQFTFIINSEAFHFTDVTEANKYVLRTKPKDKIIIENIVMPKGCFDPPKQIVLIIR